MKTVLFIDNVISFRQHIRRKYFCSPNVSREKSDR